MADGQSRRLWNDDYAPHCTSQVRYCHDGVLSGSSAYRYTQCTYCPWSSSPAQKLAFFTVGDDANAGSNTRDYHIESQLLDIIKGTTKGGVLRVAVYSFSRTGVATELINAYKRGVDVRVIVDDVSASYKAIANLKSGLGASRVTVCVDSCMGTGINHNKFVIASNLCDGSTKTVFQSSANFSNPQLWHDNNALIIRNDGALYDAYLRYWNDLHAMRQDLDYYHSANGVKNGSTGTKVYYFPRASGDVIESILNNVTCTSDTKIRIAMAYWSSPRKGIIDKLEAMAAVCDVRILIDDDPSINKAMIAYLAGRPRLKTRYKVMKFLHSKYLLIDAKKYTNNSPVKYVWTGSHNYTGPALRSNDETLLRINNTTLFNAFMSNWNAMNSR